MKDAVVFVLLEEISNPMQRWWSVQPMRKS